jgi:Flp pilus assembly protein TadG
MRDLREVNMERGFSCARIDAVTLASDNCGTVAVILAILAPLLVSIVGLAIDYGFAANQKAILQRAADAAALAGAKELSMSDSKRENASAVVKAVVDNFVKENATAGEIVPKIQTEILNQTVEVSVSAAYKSLFGDSFGFSATEISVLAVARIAGQPNICVLSLEPSEPGAIAMTGRAHLLGNNCAVFSNSRSFSGVTVTEGANLIATTICSAGGVIGNDNIDPEAYVDCPQFDDPLASRPEPDSRKCDHTAMVVLNQERTLSPGVYCLGLTIAGFSRVTFKPGVYVIKNGPFLVTLQSEIKGQGVGFFLTGPSFFTFDPLTKIELEAPKTGPMAGLLFFGSRSQSKLLLNTILSSNAQIMLGTIYLPKTSLVVTSLAQVGSKSAYTAIVARRLVMLDGPEMVLNSNYEDTDVPVPEGIKGSGQPVQLVK